MDEKDKKKGHAWQRTKERWHDNLHTSVRQLDSIIWGGIAMLAVVAVLIALEVLGIFSLFQ